MRTLKDKYINLFTDFGFKKLFGTEFNKPLLIDFLNELIGKEAGIIKDLTYLSSEQLGRTVSDRKAIFDLYCENQDGDKFIVELQKAKQNFFKDRTVFYSTFPIQQQAERGDWNFQLKAVYTIGILDFTFDEDKDSKDVFHHEVKMVDIKTDKVFYDKLTYIYLEMPKFDKTEDELEGMFDKWLFVFKNLHKLTNRPKRLQEKVFAQLFEQAAIAKLDDKEYNDYEDSLKTYRDMNNCLDTAFDEGKIEGKQEGIKEGIQKGRKEGIKQGKIETAKKLFELNLPLKDIAKATGLSLNELNKLVNKRVE